MLRREKIILSTAFVVSFLMRIAGWYSIFAYTSWFVISPAFLFGGVIPEIGAIEHVAKNWEKCKKQTFRDNYIGVCILTVIVSAIYTQSLLSLGVVRSIPFFILIIGALIFLVEDSFKPENYKQTNIWGC